MCTPSKRHISQISSTNVTVCSDKHTRMKQEMTKWVQVADGPVRNQPGQGESNCYEWFIGGGPVNQIDQDEYTERWYFMIGKRRKGIHLSSKND